MAFVIIPTMEPAVQEPGHSTHGQAAAPGPAPSSRRAGRWAARRAASDLPVGSRAWGRLTVGHLTLAAIALFSIFPVYWLFATAFRPTSDALSLSLIPQALSLENFRYVWNTIPMRDMLATTFVMALAIALGQLFVATLAAYGFAMWRFPGKKALYLLFIGSWLVPFQVTMIPNYLLVSRLGLLNTVAGVVIPQLCSAFAVLMLRQHMQAFPKELVHAAQVDGRSSLATLWRVIVPNMKPALAALGIMLFISAWNEYLWPTLILQKSTAVVQVGVRSFLSAEGNNWGAVMAAAGLACLPVFAIYLFLQRYVVDAFIRSGLK
ncbi:MAG: carbohydrate ABC transporter permease [Bifidobacteriaceae bacterium]|jgi:ABC-type glycerol-3-phosphate transport system permease component|nr:carbohydrate ABC transporter permease [Bifidobacteriaceae bacterium]